MTNTITSTKSRRLFGGIVLFALFIVLLAWHSSSASAEETLCSFGSGPGQCIEPRGVAVDPVDGRAYLADRGNNRIDVFAADGSFEEAWGWGVATGSNEFQICTSSCQAGVSGSGNGQFDGPGSLAVDSDPGSSTYRDIYIFDGNNLRVQRLKRDGSFLSKFGSAGEGPGQFSRAGDQIAVGQGGIVYVADSKIGLDSRFTARIEKFEGGAFVGSSKLQEPPVGVGGGLVTSLVIDSGGNAIVARNTFTGSIEKYELTEPEATKLGEAATTGNLNTRSLALDPSGGIFAGQRETQQLGEFWGITQYDTNLEPIARFGYEEINFNLDSMAVAPTGDGVYVSEGFGDERFLLIPLPPPGPLVCCSKAAPIGNTKATLNAGVNPEGEATSYHFEYVDQKSFEDEGGFASPKAKSTLSKSVGPDVELHGVKEQVGCPNPASEAGEPGSKCLIPNTAYRFRIVAENADSPVGEPAIAEGSFKTEPPLLIGETWSTEVGTDAAQLHAEVNPLGIPATGYFEYVDDAGFKASGFAGASRKPSEGQSPLDLGSGESMSPHSVQLSSLAPGTLYHYRLVADNALLDQPVQGEEHTFTTFPIPADPLPCPNDSLRSGLSVRLPDCRAYEMVSPVEKGNADISVRINGAGFPAGLDQSAFDGESLTYSSEKAFGDAISAPYASQYVASRDSETGRWSSHGISPPREGESLSDVGNVKFDVQFKAFSPDLAEGWLLQETEPQLDSCAPPGYPNLYRRVNAGESYEAISTAKPTNQIASQYEPELLGVSADGSHAVFRANGKLTGSASSAAPGGVPIEQLYEHVSGEGCGLLRLVSVLPNGKASALNSSVGTLNKLSTEGRENTVARAISADGSRIFWSVPQTGIVDGSGALYVRIDGSKTEQISAGPARFWTAATDGSKAIYTVGKDLFEFDVEEEASTLIAGGVVGVSGASTDASHLYFVSTEAIGGEGEAGKPNLYLREAGEGGGVAFIATLAVADTERSFLYRGFSVAPVKPSLSGIRVTPDGRHLAFVSTASLTGYDNKDTAGGKPNLELYLYEAEGGGLACISCNPSGVRPTGREFEGTQGVLLKVAAQMAPAANQLYAPRNLSANGNHLFFESFEALVARDTNGKADVYEWQRASSDAECEQIGAELHVPSSSGCLSLISSGQSSVDSKFVDASAEGSDVFIKTASSLSPQDTGLIDIYDAREGGGETPLPPPVPGCEGEACQDPPEAPNDPTPASVAFEGAGNFSEPPPTKCRKGKVRRRGRCVARRPDQRRRAYKRKNDQERRPQR